MDHNSNSAFEPWMLTAYVLNELDDQQRRVVDDYLKLHPECNSEVESIRSMADRVEVEFARSQDAIPIRVGDVRNADPLSGALVAGSEIAQSENGRWVFIASTRAIRGFPVDRFGRFARRRNALDGSAGETGSDRTCFVVRYGKSVWT